MAKSLRRRRQEAAKKRKQQQIIMFGISGIGVMLLLVAATWSLSSQAPPRIDVNNGEQVALGKQVYETQCASCHGANLEGEENWREPSDDGLLKAPAHDETGHTWHHNDAYLFDSVKEGGVRLPADSGVSPMPAYKDILTDEEIAASISYIQSTWSPEIRIEQARR